MPWDVSVDLSRASTGWALQVDIGEAHGLHSADGASMPQDEVRPRSRCDEDAEMLRYEGSPFDWTGMTRNGRDYVVVHHI